MANILIVYATVHGQAERIARRLGEVIRSSGHAASVLRLEEANIASIAQSDAVIIGGSIRYGHYPRALEAFVRDYRDTIESRANAFFSVCLSAGGPGAKPAVAWGYVKNFMRRTGWEPARIASFAGALLYTRYNPFIRFMMRLIVGSAGGETDTSRDYEYTDWAEVERFASEVAAVLREQRAA